MAVRGELDWIVMKCLDKERNRRYESANALAQDIERYLNDEPVQACPPSVKYRIGKFARRNKLALMMAGVVAAGLLLALIGLAATTLLVSRANESTQQALDRERRTGYFQRVALAEREWSAGNLSRSIDLLNQCPQDLRGWEWRYLRRLSGQQMPVLRHESSVFACAISPNGAEIAAVDQDGYITLWDLGSGQQLRRFRGHENVIWCVAFNPDGVRLATGDRTGHVKIWDAGTGEELRGWQMPPPVSYIGAVAFSPDGRQLACACNRDQDGKYSSIISLWDPVRGEQLLTLPQQGDYVMRMAFSTDGRRLASACSDDTMRVSDALTGETLRTFRPNAGFCVAVSADGRLVAAGGGGSDWESSGTITIWDLATGVERFSLPGHGAKDMAFSPDGKRLATAGADLTVRIWDVASGQEALTLRGHLDFVRTVAFTPDGHRLVSASDDRTVRIWDATPWQRGEKRGEELVTLHGHTHGLNAVVFHPSEPRLVTGGNDGTVRTWDRDTGREHQHLQSDYVSVQTLAFSPDGNRMAIGGTPGASKPGKSATVLDTSSGAQIRRLGAHDEDIATVAFSPDGKRLASGGTGDVVMISDIDSGTIIHRREGHGWYVTEVVFSPDPTGRLIASAGSDGMVHLWDAATGRELDASPLRHQGIVDGLVFSPDGQFLASGAWEGSVRIWDTKTWKQSQTLPTNGFVRCLAYSPDGDLLAWGTSNALVQVWHKTTGEIHSLRGHLNSVRGVAFSPDGKLIASASQDGTAKIWAVPHHESKSTDE
jgi:WD40 repeat protein